MLARHHILILIVIGLMSWSCEKKNNRFELIDPDVSGISFSNTIIETDSIHYFNFPYIYTGAGVGIADFNHDGLQDIFFSGNMVPCKLYLNKGNFQFEDITQQAGIETTQWVTGVSIVDINQDGWMDIYLCVGGAGLAEKRKNLLYVNDPPVSPLGKGGSERSEQGGEKIVRGIKFTESSATYGIADNGHSTQAAFFDYDRDGDLDLYVMTHANEAYANISKLYTYTDGTGPSTDRLYRNEGTDSLGHPFYRNVSREAGILTEGYGLGLVISDLNQDGWPDIYVANDFIANDLMYLNQQDGTFANRLKETTHHTSQNGMGVDIADFNNDGRGDIMVLDMLPESNHRQKTMTANMNYNYFTRTLDHGFSPQFIRNTLQLHQGLGPDGAPAFSEVGRLAGVHQTDWSWAPLFGDFDNDGLLDVYITNGFRRDVTDHDFQEYHEQTLMVEQGTGELSIPKVLEQLFKLDSVCLPNYIFQNQGGIQFLDRSEDWGITQPSMSNGSAYADFDNDGDLDLVVNNINAPAFLYKNQSDQDSENHFLKIKLKGPSPNQDALGAKLTAWLTEGKKLFREHYPVRGYLSSVEAGIHLGLGGDTVVKRLEIIWPDGKKESYSNLQADSTYHLVYGNGAEIPGAQNDSEKHKALLFQEVSQQLNIKHQHIENTHSDFNLEPLVPHLYDHYGPGIAVGDVNGDGLEDFFVGGAREQTGTLFFQQRNGTFASKPLEGSEMFEDMGALLFDADEDGDLDLYVVSGGSSVKYFQKGHYQDRLYMNDGKGNFRLDPEALPDMPASGSCVIADDFDKDGDWDLFIGGRVVPGKFPTTPRSYLLENRDGTFHDITEEKAAGLAEIGMVTAALWTDYDNDQDRDLLVVGEWMPITLFENNEGHLHQSNIPAFQHTSGWWNSMIGGDMDQDGDIDYIAGNLGANNAYQASLETPVRVYAKDFDQNGAIDAIPTRFIQGKEYPVAPRGAMINQMESIRRLFPNYQKFSEADIHQVLAGFDTTDMQTLEAHYFSSSYIENLGDGSFSIRSLPKQAQLAPLFGLEVKDVDADGHLDILGTGNFFPTEVISGWYDAHKGIFLRGNSKGFFESIPMHESGFLVDGDARALVSLTRPDEGPLVLASMNADSIRAFRTLKTTLPQPLIRLLPGEIGAEITLADGQIRKQECYRGQGYLSQSSCVLELEEGVRSVVIFQRNGISRTLSFD